MIKAYLLLGSNEGNRIDWLNKAMAALEQSIGKIVAKSSLYETAAWGKEDQPDFLNMALCIETQLSPQQLLQSILQTEIQLGRHRTVKWGQRTIDIDILFYGNEVIDTPDLKVPHPYIQERRFALVPMNEIAPELLHPILQKTIAELLVSCPDKLEVRLKEF
ncbi:MAG: 2-amino-4-hydroxy-6-hydroxymethyldihydropteridine diphosphokinase [Bacteroidetes bacterium]|nr:2-amino-4-hydroxy-6-hydroxymethyldihydropteridine diphosphokinase [Bacteroidota bacterium]